MDEVEGKVVMDTPGEKLRATDQKTPHFGDDFVSP